MMSNIISLKPNVNIPEALRNIAFSIEKGHLDAEDCTVIAGFEIFHLGCMDDEVAVTNAVFNMTYGIQKLMRPTVDVGVEG